eukprot:NODE_279_length_2504_cov_34.277240_g258_i0.p1 GENE.NODE_279_length_2504_cov_34.277240_g258_i0~~NODE_279_length_2504_cov_34.277240_g258_i0.p1  ORF type:complete len:785 (+),score=220.10 NODE_279_length_2504_cov_34.277240_g258_i0:72-2426(+)
MIETLETPSIESFQNTPIIKATDIARLQTFLSYHDALQLLAEQIHCAHTNSDSELSQSLTILLNISCCRQLLGFRHPDCALFLISILAELLHRDNPDIVLLSASCINNLLRLDTTVNVLRNTWIETKGGKLEVFLNGENRLSCQLVAQSALFKCFVNFLNLKGSKHRHLQLRALACMSTLLLSHPEDQRASKLFCASTLEKTFSICVEALTRICDGLERGSPVDLELTVCTDLLIDLLSANTHISAAVLRHSPLIPPFSRVAALCTSSPVPSQLLSLARHVVIACTKCRLLTREIGSAMTATAAVQRHLALLITPGEGEERSAQWAARLQLLLAIDSAGAGEGPIEHFFVDVTKSFQRLFRHQPCELRPQTILVLKELIKTNETHRHAFLTGLPLPSLIAHQHHLLSHTSTRTSPSTETQALVFALTYELHGEEGWNPDMLHFDTLKSCLHTIWSTACDVARHQHCMLLLVLLKKALGKPLNAEFQQTFATRFSASFTTAFQSQTEHSAPAPSTTPAKSSPETAETSSLLRRISELEAEAKSKEERFEKLHADFQSIETSLAELRQWNQKSSTFDRDKMDELVALREFHSTHLSAEHLVGMNVKTLQSTVEEKTKKLEDTYMKLILLSKLYQTSAAALEKQEKINHDLSAEVKRLQQCFREKEERTTTAFTELHEKFDHCTQERIIHSKANSLSIQGLEAELSRLKGELSQLQHQHSTMASKLHTTEAQCAAQCSEIAQLRASHQKADQRCRDLDARLHRYSSVTTLIHNLAKDPENSHPHPDQ